MIITRDQILLSLQSSLIGEIYKEIRAIAFKHNPTERKFILRFYLDRKIEEYDYECANEVLSTFISDFQFNAFNEIEVECIYNTNKLNELDILDALVYCRKEQN